jgi:mannan endo-1,4-beta-mannosidase
VFQALRRRAATAAALFVLLAVAVAVAVAAGLALAVPPASASATASAVPAGLVGRAGTSLTLNGQPWRFVGFNDYQLTSLPGGAFACGRTVDQTTLNAILADAKSSGATAIRTWFFQSYYDLGAQRQPVTPSWTAFDRLLSAAAAHGLKVIPVLVNEWQDCEPASVNKNLGFFQSAYRSPGYGYPLSYRTYATTVARHYAADPRIAFWQLGNELESNSPGGCDANAETAGAHALRTFADDMTTAVKAVDPSHMVSLGTLGSGQCGLAGADYQYVHAGGVDLCEYHDYGDAVHALPSDGYNRLAERLGQCGSLNKPLFVGESGIVADVGDSGQSTGAITSASLQLRAGFFNAKMTAAFRGGVVGYLLWDKEQDASNSSYNRDNGRYAVGPSSLFADPTNSVAATMATTFGAAAAATVRFSFEDGATDGWNIAWGSTLSLQASTVEAWSGSHSLALNLGAAGYPAARTQSTAGAGPGSKITYHLYVPASAPAGLQAEPYVSNQAWQQTFAPAASLGPGWNAVTWAVPSGVSMPLQAVGIQLNDGPGYRGPVYLDDVAW